MPKQLDIAGQKFNRLTAISSVGTSSNGKTLWKFLCDCGNITIAIGSQAKNGNTKSCGCWKVERTSARFTKHGGSGSWEYDAYLQMIRRCYDPRVEKYSIYGARGITICDRWLESFDNFHADMGSRPSPIHSVERIDNNGLYSPDNCRWATPLEQGANTRQNRTIEFAGQKHHLSAWARICGVTVQTLHGRLRRGHTLAEYIDENLVRR